MKARSDRLIVLTKIPAMGFYGCFLMLLMHVSIYLTIILITGMGAYTDFRYHKIYNKLTILSILAGMGHHLLTGGLRGLLVSLFGLFIGCIFAIFWIMGMLKAGDVKLYMAVGAIAGWKVCGYTMVCSVLFGGVAAFFFMMIRKNGRASGNRLKEYMLHLLYTKQFCTYQPDDKNAYFSFGGCIFIGVLIAVWHFTH